MRGGGVWYVVVYFMHVSDSVTALRACPWAPALSRAPYPPTCLMSGVRRPWHALRPRPAPAPSLLTPLCIRPWAWACSPDPRRWFIPAFLGDQVLVIRLVLPGIFAPVYERPRQAPHRRLFHPPFWRLPLAAPIGGSYGRLSWAALFSGSYWQLQSAAAIDGCHWRLA